MTPITTSTASAQRVRTCAREGGGHRSQKERDRGAGRAAEEGEGGKGVENGKAPGRAHRMLDGFSLARRLLVLPEWHWH